ncbi:hypothetical protein BGP82_26505 [Pseudomonas putida]|uniref:Putative tail fiber protein gp53-like C-terminal domain-containing protein n=1 Tax=Pseudomonas putida TaxID=303 RepID=A0A2S3WL88_PSEPU|nr:phage tail protein [Pseudomonas putida]POG01000.1 hypothetical protein BGP82_26505 [Pseudomonas putida]
MADLPENIDWTAGIYQLETSDPVLGGPDGIDNLQAKQLANRTRWLKDQIEKVVSGATSIGKAIKLATARNISVSGAATGSASFDGSANANIALTLADSGAVAGTYTKVIINAKGLVTGGSAMVAADIPALDWSKIITGKPTTLAGYGITDALASSGNAVSASKLVTARTISVSGAATGSASFDGSANTAIALTLADSGAVAGTYTKVTINAKGLVTGGSAMVAADIPALDWSKITTGKPTTLAGYGIVLPTQVEAEAGTDNALPMTPLRVFQAIAKVVGQATETLFGWAKVATQAQVNAGTDDSTFITPKKLRMGFSAYVSGNGYITFPSWLGGLIIQWGLANSSTSGITTTLPLAFPNNAFKSVAVPINAAYAVGQVLTTTTITVTSAGGIPGCGYIAIGN